MTDEQIAAQSIVDEFRQALADCQFKLATANATIKIRDRRIAELEAERATKPGPYEMRA